ncbi:MAG TPA: hypothetical protein VHQ43_04345 [Solirubrobacterales bacterium]|jgi:hypothetical protein|nr:hypothetical protein [Solirubrobacterales bacterium]
MLGTRRLLFPHLLGSLLLLTASLHPGTAYSAPGDPPTGSPSGSVYQLPLQQGRADAAPKSGGGTGAPESAGGAGGGQEGDGSLYRTENNFGSSSEVPGAAAIGGAGGGSGGGSGSAGGGPTGSGPGGGAAGAAASNGSGKSGDGGDATPAGQISDAGNTSVPAGIVLLGAIALLATAVGVLSRRFAQQQ